MSYDVNEIYEENMRDWRKPSGQSLAYYVYTAADTTAALAEAARDGVLTPQAEDEAAIRDALGLSIMSSKVTDLWSDTAYHKLVTIALDGGEIEPETAVELMSEGMGGEIADTAQGNRTSIPSRLTSSISSGFIDPWGLSQSVSDIGIGWMLTPVSSRTSNVSSAMSSEVCRTSLISP